MGFKKMHETLPLTASSTLCEIDAEVLYLVRVSGLLSE